MSDDHKTALAESRSQGRAVRLYLEALASGRQTRGRTRSPELIEARLAAIEGSYAGASPLAQLELAQERIDLLAELSSLSTPTVDLDSLEQDFVANAAPYAARKGLSYAAFREVGVPAAVLSKAGLSRRRLNG